MGNTGNKSNTAILRQKAEELLKEKLPKITSQLSEIELLKLIHDIEESQIKLEMRYEELVVPEKEQAEINAKLYDFAPSGYFTLSKEGKIIGLNLNGTTILGKEHSHLINNPFSSFVSDNTKPIFNLFLNKVFNGKTKESCEITLITNGNSPMFVSLTGIVTENGEQCLITVVDITDKKQKEELLTHEQYLMRAIMNNLSGNIYFKDRASRFIRINKAHAQYFGLSDPLQAVGKTDLDFFSEEYAYNSFKEEQEIIRTGQAWSKEENEIWPDGRKTWVFTNKLPLRNLEGSIIGTFGISVDITKRKLAEEALLLAEQSYNNVFNSVSEAIYVLDEAGTFIDVNKGAEKMYQYTREELIGQTPSSVAAPGRNNLDEIQRMMQTVFETGISAQFEFWAVRKNGEVFPKEVIVNKGNYFGKEVLIATARDITETKRTEEKLIESQYHLQTIVSTEPECVKTVDAQGNLKTINPAGLEIIEADSLNQVIGKPILNIIAPEYRGAYTEMHNRVLKGESIKMEFEVISLKGTRLWVETSATPLQDNGEVVYLAITRDITDRKRAEKIQKESLDLIHKITSRVPGVVYQFKLRPDGSSCFPYASEGINQIYRVSPDEVREDASKAFANIHPDDRANVVASIQVSAQNLTQWKQEYRVKYENGTVRFLYGNAIPQQEEDGSVIWYGFITDITDQKKSEEKLRESEEKYRGLVENSPNAIVIYVDGKIVFANNECVHLMVAKNKEQLIGKPVLQFVHPENRSNVIQILKEIKVDGKPLPTSEEKFIRLDGTTVDVEIKAIPTVYKHKTAVQLIIQDITERNRTEVKLRQLSQAVEQSPATTVITDTEGNIQYVNPKFVETTGYSFDEIIGKNQRIQSSGHTSAEEYKKLWDTIKAGNAWYGEFYNKKKNGDLYWESESISPIFNTKGEITHFVGIKEDITKRKQIEQELINAKEQAEESDRLKSAFLANMSHEIRTPMNGILGFAELLKEPDLTGEEQKEYIKIIEKSGVRMLNIINDIIDISKIESKQMEVSISDTNVNEQIEYIFNFFKPETTNKGIQLVFKNGLPAKEAIIKTDTEKIYAILTNLVKNAIKFTDKGTIEFGYTLKADRKPAALEFYVKDTGVGIPKDRQQAIFDRFIQADISDKRAFQGAGLGLSISKAYVEMLGGKIWVESEEGKGSTFYFTIPYNVEPKKETVFKNTASKEEEENQIKNLKILIVEDDTISNLLISKAVKIFSKEILKATTGVEAVEACRNNPDIDLVLMDINMPIMDGYEATKQIRQFNKDVIIIAQTAFGMTSDREKAIAAGCNDYISKPINIAVLGDLIQKYFKK
ncbi:MULTISPECIES: PAS domain S-box protein [unclassified Flavobacterium]|jgi:PAS domain S-box-containing protein|uniref:PAS domain S-box protein n=1 Tax=unclassified Flavobacterium TaxID=196869 RepID=UPI0025C5F426|nr:MULTISPECIES: PAS domain S-box protein [unclassified Flavobacterium]